MNEILRLIGFIIFMCIAFLINDYVWDKIPSIYAKLIIGGSLGFTAGYFGSSFGDFIYSFFTRQ